MTESLFQLSSENIFAHLAEKMLPHGEIPTGFAEMKMHHQISEILKQQFSLLAGRQKDALAGLAGLDSSHESDNGTF